MSGMYASSAATGSPHHTHAHPYRVTTGNVSTQNCAEILAPGPSDGMCTHAPLVSYCQPWYGHCNLPSTILPADSAARRWTHRSSIAWMVPRSSRHSTIGHSSIILLIGLPGLIKRVRANGNHAFFKTFLPSPTDVTARVPDVIRTSVELSTFTGTSIIAIRLR